MIKYLFLAIVLSLVGCQTLSQAMMDDCLAISKETKDTMTKEGKLMVARGHQDGVEFAIFWDMASPEGVVEAFIPPGQPDPPENSKVKVVGECKVVDKEGNVTVYRHAQGSVTIKP